MDRVAVGLDVFLSYDNDVLLRCIQNSATALYELGHFELALGYANAAVQCSPLTSRLKALYRAGQCCQQLGQPAAALSYLWQVRLTDDV